MKIFFEFSRAGTQKYLEAFKIIKASIIENDHKLTRDLLANLKPDCLQTILSNKVFGVNDSRKYRSNPYLS